MRFLLPVALAAIGLPAAALAQSVAPPDFVADAELVLVAVTALDRNGNLVRDLRLEDFVLEDDGKRREIENIWREDATPLTIGLVADTSGSQLRVVPQHQRTLAQFLKQVLRPQDQAFLISVPYDVRMVVDTTHSLSELQNGVRWLHYRAEDRVRFGEPCPVRVIPNFGPIAGCSTALWNAVYSAAYLRMRQMVGRKALIVLSDGLDNGSHHKLADAIEAAQRVETPVYTIFTDKTIMSMGPGKKSLSRLAEQTGGRFYRASNEAGSERIFAEIEKELRNAYVLAFTPPPAARDGRFHKLKVSVKRRGVTIRTRTGYFADK